MDTFEKTELNKAFDVTSVITIHYFEHSKNYVFQGESHNFWEMVYADRGNIMIYYNGEWHELQQGYAAFHRPMQFHNIKSDGSVAPNVIVISFECNSELMDFFNDKILYVSRKEKNMLMQIIRYAELAFTTRLDDPYTRKLVKSGNTAAEQYISINIEELLLSFYTAHNEEKGIIKNKLNSTRVNMNDVFERASGYMYENTDKNLTIDEISAALHISGSELKRVFREFTGLGVITYFRNMRIERAKTLIRNGDMNITQTAEVLGYESIHCFSKQFKNVVGMSPREYSLSIKMWLDDDNPQNV